jgi:hypothetical protein
MSWKHRIISAAVLVTASLAQAGIVVLQVEAPEVDTGLYSPVDFLQKRTAPGGDLFPNQRFVAVSGVTTTGVDQGGHARSVGLAFYGPTSAGALSVSEVYVMTSGDFLGKTLLPTRRGRFLPVARLPGRPAVVNASFSGSLGGDNLDAELLRRADLLASRDSVVLVAGAVTSTTGAFQGARLLWGGRNVIAVRGDSPESVFDPSAIQTGRTHADLWDSGTASIATGRVSSVAAAMVDEARTARRAESAKPHAVRAALLVSADRSARTNSGEAWTAEQPNGLSTALGAGKLDGSAALELARAGAVRFVRGIRTSRSGELSMRRAVRPGQSASAIAIADRSLSHLTVGGRGVVTSLFRLDSAQQGVAAALTWATAPSGATGDLRLELRTVSLTPRGDAVFGGVPLLSIDAQSSNVRFLTSELSFDPGLYAWLVRNDTGSAARPALAWQFEPFAADSALRPGLPSAPRDLPPPAPIPEPGSLLGVAGFAVLLRRPRLK